MIFEGEIAHGETEFTHVLPLHTGCSWITVSISNDELAIASSFACNISGCLVGRIRIGTYVLAILLDAQVIDLIVTTVFGLHELHLCRVWSGGADVRASIQRADESAGCAARLTNPGEQLRLAAHHFLDRIAEHSLRRNAASYFNSCQFTRLVQDGGSHLDTSRRHTHCDDSWCNVRQVEVKFSVIVSAAQCLLFRQTNKKLCFVWGQRSAETTRRQ